MDKQLLQRKKEELVKQWDLLTEKLSRLERAKILATDPWHENYEGAPTDGSVWESGGDDSKRLMRGGTYAYNPIACRSAYRVKLIQDNQNYIVGLRVVASSLAWTQ